MKVRATYGKKFGWSITALEGPMMGKCIAHASRVLLRDAHRNPKGFIGTLDGWHGDTYRDGRKVFWFDVSLFGRQDNAYATHARNHGTLIGAEAERFYLEMVYLDPKGEGRAFDPCMMPEGSVPEDN